jgi:hypothetical protein
MQKAHLYEAILFVNRGLDEAVRGLERLKRAKDSRLDPSCFDEELVVVEDHRARLNSYFCSVLQRTELQDAARFQARYGEYEKKALDEVQVYRDVEALEQSRRLEGKAPRVRFLSSEELQAWEQKHSSSQGQSERREENDHARKV